MPTYQPIDDYQYEQEQAERKAAAAAKWEPWPANSIVDYEIISAIDGTSKNGDPQTVLNITLFNSKGETRALKEYLTFSEKGKNFASYKLKRICEAGGILSLYESGNVPDYELNGKTGRARLGIRKGGEKGVDENGNKTYYSDQNVIEEYLKPEPSANKTAKQLDDELDDDLPF